MKTIRLSPQTSIWRAARHRGQRGDRVRRASPVASQKASRQLSLFLHRQVLTMPEKVKIKGNKMCEWVFLLQTFEELKL